MTPFAGPACAALILFIPRIALAQVTATRDDEPGALPYHLAFDRAELSSGGWFDISPDGKWAAYVIQRSLASTTEDQARAIANRTGTPFVVMGSRVHITSLDTRRTVQACPGDANTWAPSWSKDGQTLAFYSDAGGTPQLWAYFVKDGKCRRISTAVLKPLFFIYIGNEPKWSADGQTIFVPLRPTSETPVAARTATADGRPQVRVYRSASEGPDSLGLTIGDATSPFAISDTVEIGAIDVATGRVRTLVDARAATKARLFRASSTGRWVSYHTPYRTVDTRSHRSVVDLAVVSAAGGSPIVIDTALPNLSTTIMVGSTLGYSWHPTDDRLVYAKNGGLWLVDLTTGPSTAPRRLAPSLGPLEASITWFTRDGRFVVSGLEPRTESAEAAIFAGEPSGLAVIPLDGGEPTVIRFDPSWQYEDILKTNATTLWQPDERSITVRVRIRATGESAIVRLDPRDGSRTVLWKGLVRIGGRAGTWNAGGRHDFIAGAFEDYSTPPDIYRFSADFARKDRVSHLAPKLDSVAVGTVEMFSTAVPLYNGGVDTVRTAALLPKGFQRGDKRPGIVIFYPGDDISDMAENFGGDVRMVETSLIYTSRGYVVLLAHLPITPFGEGGNPIKEMTDALLPQVYRAAELGYVDAARLGLRGQSYGGYGTAAIVSYTNLFRAAVPSNGPYDIPGQYGWLGENSGAANVAYYEGGQGRMGNHLWASFQRYIDNSPYYQADKIRTPLLIMQGGADGFAGEARKLFVALRRLGRPVQLAVYEGEGHAVPGWSVANAVDASRRMVAFFRRHLGEPRR